MSADIVVSAASATPIVTGPSLTQYRRYFGRKFSSMKLGTTGIQTSPPSGSYSGTATGASAARRIVSTDLADLDGDSRFFDLAYAFVPGLPYELRVRNGGWHGNDGSGGAVAANTISTSASTIDAGYLEMVRSWGQTLPAGLEFEVWSRLPVLAQDFRAGVHSCINQALAAQWFVWREPLTGVAGQYRWSIADASWLTRQSQLLQVVDRETVSGQDPYLASGGWALRFENQLRYLTSDTQIASGQTFYAEFKRPMSTFIRVGDTWAPSTVGLVNETDQALGPLEETVLIARYFALDTLIQLAASDAQAARYAAERERLAEIVRPYLDDEQPQAVDIWATAGGWGDGPGYLARRAGGGGIGSYGGGGRSGRSWP